MDRHVWPEAGRDDLGEFGPRALGHAAGRAGEASRVQAREPWREVIGVVQDVRDNGVHEPAPAIVYWPTFGEKVYPTGQTNFVRTVTFAIRSNRVGSEGFLNQVRQAVWSINASLPVAAVRTMQDIYDQSLARTSFTLVMLGIAGAMALVLGSSASMV